jgi:hypothetical protein
LMAYQPALAKAAQEMNRKLPTHLVGAGQHGSNLTDSQ